MIKPFEVYLEDGSVEKQLPDSNQARALMNKAEKRLARTKLLPINEDNADFSFEDSYDVMREASHALMAVRGLKPLSHEAVVAYLRDRENLEQSRVETFNSFRKLRNKSLYETINYL